MASYPHLLALTQLYLHQHFDGKGFISTDLATYNYFKKISLQKKALEKPRPPVQAPPTPILQKAKPPSPSEMPPAAPTQEVKTIQPKKEVPAVEVKSPDKQKKLDTPAPFFLRDPMAAPQPLDFTDLRQILIEKFPSQQIVDAILPVAEKKETSLEVVIIAFNESTEQLQLLTNMAKAIQERLKINAAVLSASKLEEEQWEELFNSKSLRLAIACSHGIHAHPKATQLYREAPKKAKFHLGKVSLLPLPDIALYLKEPKLKSGLWNDICGMLRE